MAKKKNRGRSGKTNTSAQANTASKDKEQQSSALNVPDPSTLSLQDTNRLASQATASKQSTADAKASGEVPLVSKPLPKANFQFETNHFKIEWEGDHIYRYDCGDPVRRVCPENTGPPQNKPDAGAGTEGDTGGNPVPRTNTHDNTPRLSARVRRRIFVLLLDQLVREKSLNVATNHKNQLITRSPIQGFSDGQDVEVSYYDEDQKSTDNNLKTYLITVSKPLEINIQHVASYLKSGDAVIGHQGLFPDRTSAQAVLKQTVDAMNIILSQSANDRTVRFWETKEPDVTTLGERRFYQHKPRTLPFPPVTPHVDVPRGGDGGQWLLTSPDNPKGLMALMGFFRSVKDYSGSNFLLNINAITGCFYQPLKLDVLINLFKPLGNRTGRDWHDIDRFIKGLRVQTKHRQGNEFYQSLAGDGVTVREKIYTVNGLASRKPKAEKQDGELVDTPYPDKVSFEITEKISAEQPAQTKPPSGPIRTRIRRVTVGDHWNDTLRIQLGRDDIIVRVGNDAKPIYFPARFLEVLPGQPFLNTVNMVKEACRKPTVNFKHISTTSRTVFGFEDVNGKFNLDVDTKLLKVNAHNLPKPQVVYGEYPNPKKKLPPIPIKSSWGFENRHFTKAPSGVVQYACVQFGFPGLNPAQFKDFQNAFEDASRNVGLQIQCVHGTKWTFDRHSADNNVWPVDYAKLDDRIVSEALAKWKRPEITMILCFLSRSHVELYSAIKRASDFASPNDQMQDTSIATICMLAQKARLPPNPAAARNYGRLLSNIQLKLNIKAQYGTINHTIRAPGSSQDLPRLLGAQTMLVGLDVTHPGKGAIKQAPSVAAMVSSLDRAFVRYLTNWDLNPRPVKDSGKSQEEVLGIAEMLRWHLDEWMFKHKRYPTEIIFYRDGLSDGQFEMCRNNEIGCVRKMLDEKYTQKDRPRLLVICTVKRHNTRFLGPANAKKTGCDEAQNPLSSTVFYSGVTQGEGRDFFLVSHDTLKGTTRPTHYVVLWNEIHNISIQDIAEATNYLCYTWQRSSSAVGLVPPSYYADKACDRARCYLYKLYHGHSEAGPEYDGNNPEHKELSSLDVGAVASHRMSYI